MTILLTLTDSEWVAVQAATDDANQSNAGRPDKPLPVTPDVFLVQQVRSRVINAWANQQSLRAQDQRIQHLLVAPPDVLTAVDTALATVTIGVTPVILPPTLG